ncbi:uncharacterized protein LOC142348016 [Convolutriloba macropyga]|uniref:uncharacterized protein LOC142348016 n=1 Tax=Convolutriloba macropyga TaxID=536237 RepID=UPI003F526292
MNKSPPSIREHDQYLNRDTGNTAIRNTDGQTAVVGADTSDATVTWVTTGGLCGNDSFSRTCHKIVLKLFSKTFHLYFLYLTVFQVLLVMTCFGLTSWKFFTRNKMEKFCLQQARIVFDVILTLTSCTKAYFAHSTEQMLAQDSELMGLDCHTGSSVELTLVTILIFILLAGESRVILFYCHNIHSLRQFLQDFEVHQLMFQAANK